MASKTYMLLFLFSYGKATTEVTSVPSSAPSSSGWWIDDYEFTWGDQNDGLLLDSWYTSGDTGGEFYLGNVSTCAECYTDNNQDIVHGWYASRENNQAYNIERTFACSSQSTVEVELYIYFCVESGDNDEFYVDIIPAGGGGGDFALFSTINDVITSRSVDDSDPDNLLGSGGDNQPGTSCSATIKYHFYEQSFRVKPTHTVAIVIRNENLEGQNNAIAWNNFRLRCLQEITQPPTRTPTGVTKDPTKTPSKYPTPAPTGNPTPAPTDLPTRNPTTARPTGNPTLPVPTYDPTKEPSAEPSKTPTMDPTENPTMKPTTSTTAQPTKNPTIPDNLIDNFGDAFSGGGDCEDSWIQCNLVVFIILLIVGICVLLYWIIGGVWFKKRQDNRPVPAHMLVGNTANNTSANVVGNTSVEMGGNTTTGATHATADRWKSAWEIEQEQKAAAAAAQQNQGGGAGGDAVYGNAGGGGGGAPGYY